MNPFLKKEIRLLLPSWVAALLLAIIPVFFISVGDIGVNGNRLAFVNFLFIAGIILLAISPFGLESGFNTFSVMLAQPVPRRRLWVAKVGLLALATLTVVMASWAAWFCHTRGMPQQHYLLDLMEPSAWWVIVFVAGGLWTSLLFRQIIAAFWITLITPLLLGMVIGFLLDNLFPNEARYYSACFRLLDVLYVLAGFFWAMRLFYQAQDTQWTGGEITFLSRRPNAGSPVISLNLPRHWFPALVWKEIQFHQVNIAIAAVVLVLHLVDLFVRMMHPRFEDRDVQFGLETIWVLWLLMPFLIGSAAVAEERKLGVAESQLYLPVSRRAQFTIKFVVAFLLSMLFGAVAPSVIEQTPNFGETNWVDHWIFYAAPVLFFVSFYASTLTRSSLLAMAATIGLPMILGPIVTFVVDWLFFHPGGFYPYYEIEGRVVCLIFTAAIVLFVVLIGLMFWNFKWLHQNAKLWRRNALVVLLSFAFICVATNVIFFRTWEYLSPVDAPHGPARVATGTPVTLYCNWDTLAVALPAGKLWSENLRYREVSAGKLASAEWYNHVPDSRSQHFVGDADWSSTAFNRHLVLGIQPDGSLWATPFSQDAGFKVGRIGTDADWVKVTHMTYSFLLLKKDGSVWIWGTNDAVYTRKNIFTLPTRLGNENDWTNLFPLTDYWTLAQKSDGTWWNWLPDKNDSFLSSHATQVTNLNNEWLSVVNDDNHIAGVKMNHELWFLYQPTNGWTRDGGIPAYQKALKLGSEARWQAVTLGDSGWLLLLGTDGTLWKWKYSNNPYTAWADFKLEPFNPIQLGKNSDWIAVASGGDGMAIALAADGGVWSWGQRSDHVWLAPSRKPLYMGNIFDGSPRSSTP